MAQSLQNDSAPATVLKQGDRAWSHVAEKALVDRVTQSPSFAKSERLSSLLTYLCRTSFNGKGEELNEQKIGHAVFGRNPDYDTSADGIVRTQVSRLRQKLEYYFDIERANEPLRITIPRGNYVPVFELRELPPQSHEISSQETVVAESRSAETDDLPAITRRTSLIRLPWIFCALLAAALLVTIWQIHKKSRADDAGDPSPLWSRIFRPSTSTLLVPADSGLVIYHKFNPRSVSLDAYMLGEYRTPGAINPTSPGNVEDSTLAIALANRRYTSIVDLEIASALTERAVRGNSQMRIRYARDLRPNDLKTGNVVLLGAAEANPWVLLYEHDMNFVLQNNYNTNIFSVLNRSPRPGEPSYWDSAKDDPQRHVYGVVAFRPNLSGDGNALIIEGTSMAGSEAAWDFLMDNDMFDSFLKKIEQSNGSVPHFELLLESQSTGASASRVRVIAWRTGDTL